MEEEKLPYLILTTESITIVQTGSVDKVVSKANSESLRERANNFFKTKKYVEAILLYEQSLMHLHDPSHRNRSILFSNTAACLYELKLYKSCMIYADLAILADPSYNKGYYRKINSLLELKRYSDVIPLLGKIYTLISKPDFESLNTKYTYFVSNDGGIFNWTNIIQGKCTAQG
jgi:tetratricopeptide (TPR) repeat protein